MKMKDISLFVSQKQRLLLDSLQYNTSYIPRWRRPLIGYLIGIFLIVVSLTLDLIGRLSFIHVPVPGIGLYLYFVTLIIAIFWGLGPSILVLFASFLAVDYLYIQPVAEALHYDTLEDLANVAAFIGAGILTAFVGHRREAARIRAQINESVAQQSQQQLENFIAVICHELKTPITGASGCVQLVKRKLGRYNTMQPQEQGKCQRELLVGINTILYLPRAYYLLISSANIYQSFQS